MAFAMPVHATRRQPARGQGTDEANMSITPQAIYRMDLDLAGGGLVV